MIMNVFKARSRRHVMKEDDVIIRPGVDLVILLSVSSVFGKL